MDTMKLDAKAVISIIQRKGVSWFGAMAIGMVWCAVDDDIRDIIKKYIVLLGGTGSLAMVSSTIWSIVNESKLADLKETAEDNLYRAPEGMMIVTAKTEAADPIR